MDYNLSLISLLPGQFSFLGSGRRLCDKFPGGDVGGGWMAEVRREGRGSRAPWDPRRSGEKVSRTDLALLLGTQPWAVGANIPPVVSERNREERGQLEQRRPSK